MVETLINLKPLVIKSDEFLILSAFLEAEGVDHTLKQFMSHPIEHSYHCSETQQVVKRAISNRSRYWVISKPYKDGLVPEVALELLRPTETIVDTYIHRKLVDSDELAWFSETQREEAIKIYVKKVLAPLKERADALQRPLVRCSPYMVDSSLTGSSTVIGIFLREAHVEIKRDSDSGWADYGTAIVAYPVRDQMKYINRPIESLDLVDIETIIENPLLLMDIEFAKGATALVRQQFNVFNKTT